MKSNHHGKGCLWNQSHSEASLMYFRIMDTEELCASSVIFHLPEKAFLGIHYWIFFSLVCCKHSHPDTPDCADLFINIYQSTSNMSLGVTMKDSVCELKRSPMLKLFTTSRSWSESDARCLENAADSVHSATLTDQNLFVCFFFSKAFLTNGLWSANTRKWYITGAMFQKEQNAFIQAVALTFSAQ